MNENKQFAKFIKLLGESASKLTDKQIFDAVSGKYTIQIKLVRTPVDGKPDDQAQLIDVSELITELESLSSREETIELLDKEKKKTLELVARKLEIAVTSSDRVETLKEKIVGATVGARIRSAAIQQKKI